MSKFKRGAWLILAALLLSAPAAWAQTTGRIMGSLKDAQGAVLPGATVTLTGPALQGAQTQVTDQDGAFRFMSVPPGRYTVKIELAGFKTLEQSDVQVGLDRAVDLVLTMQVAGLAETVTVRSTSPTSTRPARRSASTPTPTSSSGSRCGATCYAIARIAPGHDRGRRRAGGARVHRRREPVHHRRPEHDRHRAGQQTKQLNFDFIEEIEVKTGGLPPSTAA